MPPKKPEPIFEVRFAGVDLYPERIPLRTLSESLSAIKRLATGNEIDAEEIEDEDEGTEDTSLTLIGVKRGSAIYQVTGPHAMTAVASLKAAGKLLKNPENVEVHNDYMLSPIERLSTIARRLNCTITLREPRTKNQILAKIEPTSYEAISKTLLIAGQTSFLGRVERVGGATAMRCGLRVGFQDRMLICRVADKDIARKIGERLYQQVVVRGLASWLKNSWKLFAFTIEEVTQPEQGSLQEAIKALREAGGKAWDDVANPEAFLAEIRGER